jgi:hypothetical protein
LECSQVILAPEHRLLQAFFFLHETLSFILVESLCREIPRACQTREENLHCQYRLLLLQTGFAVLKHLPLLCEALCTHDERLHLHLQFDPLTPEKLASLLQWISWLLPVLLVLLLARGVALVLLMVTIEMLLVVHKETFLLFSVLLSSQASSTKEDRIIPL